MNKKTVLVNLRGIIYFLKSVSSSKTDIDDCYLYIRERLNDLYVKPYKTEPWVCYTLYELFRNLGGNCFFNKKCYLGSMLCILGLDDEALLVRGALLSNTTGTEWPHGWVEFNFNGKDMVLDTTMRRIFYKDIYYSLYEPKIDTKIPRKIIMRIDYLQTVLNELKNPKNELDLKEVNNNKKLLKIL